MRRRPSRPRQEPRVANVDGTQMIRDIATLSAQYLPQVIADISSDEHETGWFKRGSIDDLIYQGLASSAALGYDYATAHRCASAYAMGIRVGVALALAGRDEALDQ